MSGFYLQLHPGQRQDIQSVCEATNLGAGEVVRRMIDYCKASQEALNEMVPNLSGHPMSVVGCNGQRIR